MNHYNTIQFHNYLYHNILKMNKRKTTDYPQNHKKRMRKQGTCRNNYFGDSSIMPKNRRAITYIGFPILFLFGCFYKSKIYHVSNNHCRYNIFASISFNNIPQDKQIDFKVRLLKFHMSFYISEYIEIIWSLNSRSCFSRFGTIIGSKAPFTALFGDY
jgi:hypothetical protein